MQKLTTLEKVSNRIDALSADCYDQNIDVPDISFNNINTVNIAGEPRALKPIAQRSISNRLGITIIDWKTGRNMSKDMSMQLSCYAMYAMDKWGIDPEKVKLIEYNLLANQGVEFTVGAPEIENTKTYIAGSIADMQSLLVDRDDNVPKDEESFVKIEDEKIRSRCNFQKVCD